MRKTITLAMAFVLAGLTVSACRDHPGYPSDHHHHHDGDHDHYR